MRGERLPRSQCEAASSNATLQNGASRQPLPRRVGSDVSDTQAPDRQTQSQQSQRRWGRHGDGLTEEGVTVLRHPVWRGSLGTRAASQVAGGLVAPYRCEADSKAQRDSLTSSSRWKTTKRKGLRGCRCLMEDRHQSFRGENTFLTLNSKGN